MVDYESISPGSYPVELELQDFNRKEGIKSTQTFALTVNVIDANAKEPSFRITSVSSRGLVTLQFDQNMVQIGNLTMINATVLDVSLEMQDEQVSILKANWTVTSFTSKAMQIQLDFEDPLNISKSFQRDILQVKVIDPQPL